MHTGPIGTQSTWTYSLSLTVTPLVAATEYVARPTMFDVTVHVAPALSHPSHPYLVTGPLMQLAVSVTVEPTTATERSLVSEHAIGGCGAIQRTVVDAIALRVPLASVAVTE